MICSVIFLLFCLAAGAFSTGSPRIVIVGAGSSGIAAASKLLQNGFEDVLILEAENRIGGRVNTVKFDGYDVDLGAQWIHGEKGNVVYDLVAPLNITDHSDPFFNQMFSTTGEMLDQNITTALTTYYLQLLETVNTTNDCSGSLGVCFGTKLKKRFAEFPELNETMQDRLLWHFNLMQTSLDPADSWDDVSAVQYSEYVGCEGDSAINWKERGYSTILDVLMKKFPNPEEELPVLNKTILEAEVTKVDYSSEDGTVKLTTQDGKKYVADHVIMTPSLGVLKAQYETLFNPQLPESKIRNIKGLGFGNACKIVLAFNDTWFNYRGMKNRGYTPLWSEAERKELDSDPKTRWLAYALGINVVEHKPRLLLIWVSGKGARLMDDLTDTEVLAGSLVILDILRKEYNISAPRAMIRSKWHQNKHFRGTYSYRSMESVRVNASAMQLAEPIMKMGKPVILFAGEATNEHYFSTVHGAIGSGWREAERLINLYSKSASTTEQNSQQTTSSTE